MNKKHIIIIIIGGFLVAGGLFFLLSHKKLPLDSSTGNYMKKKTDGLELYKNEDVKEQISEHIIKDSTGLCNDNELQDIKDLVNIFEEEFLKKLLTYDGTNSEYLTQVQLYYADAAIYAKTNVVFLEHLLNHFNTDDMTASFQSVNIITTNIREKTDAAMVVSVRGIINTNLQSKTISSGNYDCIYRSDILVEDGKCKVLDIELSKIFEQGVTAAWEDEDHITVQFKGNFVSNWNIGNEAVY